MRTTFPDREFFMRSQGQVRFITISSKLQIAAVALVAAIALVWLAAMGAMLVSQFSGAHERAQLLQREAQVASAEGRVKEYRKGVGEVAADLERRQQIIEQAISVLPDVGDTTGTVSDSASEAGATVKRVSMMLPEAAGLARIEARQLAVVEKITRVADARAQAAEKAIRRVGLNPQMLMAKTSRNNRTAQGGPLLSFLRKGEKLDPRFERLNASLARMSALQEGLDSIPSTLPARLEFISSGFGYRSDPFTGSGAMHSGLDFRGPTGAPIYAAADGKVSYAGQRSGYGNVIEIEHGNGLMTRYAHMSRFDARAGQKVSAGDVIGGIGSTGRSTGPHLHFEVRLNDRPINPRPFLEMKPATETHAHVQQEIRGGHAAKRG